MIIFHDVDGCLNAVDGLPIGFTQNALSSSLKQSLTELGQILDSSTVKHFVLNTGRSWQTTEYLCRAIGSPKLRYALVEHGSELWDIETGMSVDLVKLATKHNLESILTALTSVQSVSKLIAWYQADGSTMLSELTGHIDNLGWSSDKSSNLTIPVPEKVDGNMLMSTLRDLICEQEIFAKDQFVYHHSKSDGFIDVMGKMDKGMGVEIVLKLLDGEIGDTVAVGNGLNDIPMLSAVALPICPANSESTVKSLCQEKGHLSSHDYIETTKEWLRVEAGNLK